MAHAIRRLATAIFLAAILGPGRAPAAEPGGEDPAWLSQTIIPKGEFIYSVGRSAPQESEKEAKDDALADATEQFVKYCGVSVETFSRSVEVYSRDGAKEYASSDYQAQSRLRARAFVSRAVPEEWRVVHEKKAFVAAVLLKVPKAEFDRIVKEKNIKLSLDMLFYYEDSEGKMKVLDEGGVLKSGDGYAIYAKPSDDCHLYVYQVDALGKSFRLFPNEQYRTATNPVPAASDLWIPGDRELYTLDATTGKERFYIFASPNHIPEFEGEDAAGLAQKDLDDVVSLKKMGVAGLQRKRDVSRAHPPKSGSGRAVVEVKRKLAAEGAFVYETWFWHR